METIDSLNSGVATAPPPAPAVEMASPAPEPSSATVRPGRERQPRPGTRPKVQESLFRVVWRWHFYAGMIIAPVLVVMSITGGIYIFRSEIEEFAKSDLLFVKTQATRVGYQSQIDAAVAAHPGFVPSRIQIHNEANRATLVTLSPAGQKGPPSRESARRNLTVSVNPYDGKVVGTIAGDSQLNTFFVTILTIHRTLWAGTSGRIITELTTSWSLVLLVTGLYLWWPRKKAKAAGVWTLRWKAKLYTVLRDVHSVGGIYLLPIAFTIVGTGMFYTLTVGTVVHEAAEAWVGEEGETKGQQNSGKDARKGGRPQAQSQALAGRDLGSKPATRPDSKRASTAAASEAGEGRNAQAAKTKALPLDELLAVMKKQYPDRILFASLGAGGRGRRGQSAPPKPENSMQISAGNDFNRTYGPMVSAEVTLDKSNGQVLKRELNSEKAFFWHAWTYPLHVGSFWGLATKIPWFIACVVLTILPVTGLWMWWERRPQGKLGLPRKPEVRMPWWLGALISVLCVVLPMMGASVVLILIGEGIARVVRRFRQPAMATV